MRVVFGRRGRESDGLLSPGAVEGDATLIKIPECGSLCRGNGIIPHSRVSDVRGAQKNPTRTVEHGGAFHSRWSGMPVANFRRT